MPTKKTRSAGTSKKRPPSSLVRFFSQHENFKLKNQKAAHLWLDTVASANKRTIGTLNYIFVSDDHLLSLNQHYLRHQTLTDIITFDYSSDEPVKNTVSGEIYISVDRVRENAGKFGVTFQKELDRVMAHGLLHLCGLRDKTPIEQKRMRKAEEKAIVLR